MNSAFDIFNQAGCIVQDVIVDGEYMSEIGPQMIDVLVKPSFKSGTIFVDVYCITGH